MFYHEVRLKFTNLTHDQSSHLVARCLESPSLTHLSLYGVNLSHVSWDMLARLKQRVKMYI